MAVPHVIARTGNEQHEFIDSMSNKRIATVTYHDGKEKPFRLAFEAWVEGTSTSWHKDLTRVNEIVSNVHEHMIQ